MNAGTAPSGTLYGCRATLIQQTATALRTSSRQRAPVRLNVMPTEQ